MWPTSAGNKLRQFQLLRGLARQGHRITLLIQNKGPLDAATRATLEPMVERLVVHKRRPRKHPITLAAALLAPYPVIVSVNGLSGSLRNSMAELLKESWDVVHVEHSYGLQSLLGAMEAARQPFTLSEHNVESSLAPIADYHPRMPAPVTAQLRRYDGWRYRNWERRALTAAARVIAVTRRDSQRLSEISGRPVDVVENGVDTVALADVNPDCGSRRLMFIGNYDYPPNAAAVETTVERILPALWQRCPNARFAFCGPALRAVWRERWTDPRIEWRGFVEDPAEELRRSALLVAPLNAGGGSKLKVLEAMGAGLGVVCTPEAVSGLQVRDGREYREGRTPEELAAHIADLFEHEDEIRQMGARARQYVQHHHDWRPLADRMAEIFRELPRRA
jgi:glycosyltransferase involved in cell wall biosynthesis